MADKKIKTKMDSELKKDIVKELISLLIYLAGVFLAVYVIIHFVGQRTTVSGSSMETTLSNGDNLIIDKISYRFHDPERFDVVVFPYRYAEDTYYIKRVIGLPHETVWIDYEGNIYINGEILDENYGLETIVNPGLAAIPFELSDDEYFVLGDNRNNSEDSRFGDVGNLKREEIIGKAWIRIYPFNKFGAFDRNEE